MRSVKPVCKYCKKKLSKYNKNEYCFAHQAQGIEDGWTDKQKLEFNRYQKQKAQMYAKNKERRRAKSLS
jgi:hypothetical protein